MSGHRQRWLLAAFGGTFLLWVYSQTAPGKKALATVVDSSAILVSRVSNLAMSHGYADNNPLNIRFIANNPFNGQNGNHGGYGTYDTPQNGTRAAGKQLQKYFASGLRTVGDIVSKWAPDSENDTLAYINDVCDELEIDRENAFTFELDFPSDLPRLTQAMAKHENGYVDSSYDWNWVYL